MAATLQEPTERQSPGRDAAVLTPERVQAVPEQVTEPVVASRHGMAPAMVGILAMTASILVVLGATMAMALVMTDVSVLAAFGFGVYCAFWLGIGFGTILASALVFGREH